MHPGLNGSMAINDTILVSKKHRVTGINSLVGCVACFMIMSAHCGSEHRHTVLVCVCMCVHVSVSMPVVHTACVCVCVSINQGMFIRSTMCVPDSIK